MIVRTYSVFCDAPDGSGTGHAVGCAGWVVETVKGSTEARRIARGGYGWRRHDGKDLSPECYRVAVPGPEEISG